MVNFDFLEKGLGVIPLPHFVFLVLYSINWTKIIVWLSLLFNFEIDFMYLIKPFFYMTKKLRQKSKYLEKEKSLLIWNKKHFSSFLKGLQLPKIISNLRVHL